MSRDTVKIADTTKQRLENYRNKDGHTSFDSAVRTLLDTVERPLPTQGIADSVIPRDALRVAEFFGIADRTYPLPDTVGGFLAKHDHRTADDSSRTNLTHKFRLYIAGHWLVNTNDTRSANLPHFDAFSMAGGGWLFKLKTGHDSPYSGVTGVPDGEFWLALGEGADFEESVLEVTGTNGVEFLAPAGGVPEDDERGGPVFGGYDSYWDDDSNNAVYAEGFHGLRTIPEFLADEGLELFTHQLGSQVTLFIERATHAKNSVEEIRAEAIESADSPDVIDELRDVEFVYDDSTSIDWDATTSSLSEAAVDAIQDARMGRAIPGGKVDTNDVSLPVSLALDLHLLKPSMSINTELDGVTTVGELMEEAPDERIGIPMLPVVAPPNDALRHAFDAEDWHFNPNNLSFDEVVEEFLRATPQETPGDESMEALDDFVGAMGRTGVEFPPKDDFEDERLYYGVLQEVKKTLGSQLGKVLKEGLLSSE